MRLLFNVKPSTKLNLKKKKLKKIKIKLKQLLALPTFSLVPIILAKYFTCVRKKYLNIFHLILSIQKNKTEKRWHMVQNITSLLAE